MRTGTHQDYVSPPNLIHPSHYSSPGSGLRSWGVFQLLTFMLTQVVDAALQDGRLVHLPAVAWQHGGQLHDKDVELVSAVLLRLVSRHAGRPYRDRGE